MLFGVLLTVLLLVIGDRLLYNGTAFDLLPAGAGGGLTEITGTAPVVVSAVADGEQDVSMPAANCHLSQV